MSLINDAIKRTQQSTQAQQPPRLDELELPPLDPISPPSNDGSGAKRILWIVVLVVVVVNVMLWLAFKDRGSERQVTARTDNAELVEAAVVEAEAVAVVAPDPAPVEPEPSAEPLETMITVPEVVTPVIVDRPKFKLNTIVSHPVRPSAMINNRVLFVGDRVEGYTVTAISQDEVTLTKDDDEVIVGLP